jgi:hypothetical protein
MSDTKHTPGPWILDFPHPGTDGESLVSPSYHFVDAGKGYYPNGFGLSLVASEADARLIAAAPELLEALEMAQLWLDYDGRYDMQKINAAIAKAKGESE